MQGVYSFIGAKTEKVEGRVAMRIALQGQDGKTLQAICHGEVLNRVLDKGQNLKGATVKAVLQEKNKVLEVEDLKVVA